MKLSLKLTFFIMAVMAILLAIHSLVVIEREVNLFEEDMERHANLVGNIVLASLPNILQSEDTGQLEEFIENIDKSEEKLKVRLVDVISSKTYPAPLIELSDITPLSNGQEMMLKGIGADGDEALFAYFPISIDPGHLLAIEISESMSPMKDYVRNTIYRKIALFVAMVLFGSLLVLWVGAKMVGKPISEMAQLASRVADGDFSGSVPIHDKHDELAHLAAGLNDMVRHLARSRKRLEEETAKKLETIKELHHSERLATVGKLASGLAHELGTPLNVVSGRAKMISTGDMESEEISESADVIVDQADRMTKIIRQLLDFARRRTTEKSLTDVFEPINQTISLLNPMASAKKVKLLTTEGSELPKVNIDSGQIQQVLSNLITNAIHAMSDGGEIVISAERTKATPPADIGFAEGDFICVRVTDHGSGIAEADLNRVFTPFFSTKGVGEGTGLGLSISHGIVREHGGWIGVSSEVGKGSVFSVFLPLEEDA
jgi:two-component system NtrC family sensor kinase